MLVLAAFHLTCVPADHVGMIERAKAYVSAQGGAAGLRKRYGRDQTFAVPILTVGIALLPMSLFSRAVSSFDTRQSSNLDRIRMVQAGIEMIRDYPLLGVGPANVKEIYPLYRASDALRDALLPLCE